MSEKGTIIADIGAWIQNWLDRFNKNAELMAPLKAEENKLFEELHEAFGKDRPSEQPEEVKKHLTQYQNMLMF